MRNTPLKGMLNSKSGYKRNSHDKNNPYNIIRSGNITMKDVDFPVKAVDNLGNKKIMKPGKNYKFPGNIVTETKLENNIEILDGQVILKFSKNDFRKSYEKSILKINNIKREINNDVEQKYLKESLNPNPIHWDIISKLAHLTFVPASDESRNLGAGGGNDND